MTAQILDGRAIAADVREQVRIRVERQTADGQRPPGLVVILVGENPASQVYVRNMQAACEQVGFHSELMSLPVSTPQAELLKLIDKAGGRLDHTGAGRCRSYDRGHPVARHPASSGTARRHIGGPAPYRLRENLSGGANSATISYLPHTIALYRWLNTSTP